MVEDDPRRTVIILRYHSCNLETNSYEGERHTAQGYDPKAEKDGLLLKDEANPIDPHPAKRTHI